VFNAVVTTGTYCRPTCSAHPKPENVREFAFAAAAEAAGFRACHRCRPYRDGIEPPPGSDLACRALDLIAAGAMDDNSEADLAARLGVSARHLRRIFVERVGATPDHVARSRRAHFARRLLDETDLAIADIAFASGFGSLRQFNRVIGTTFRASPRELRARRRRTDRLVADGGLALRLPARIDLDAWLRRRAATAIPGVEHVTEDGYRRTVLVGGDPAVIEIRKGTSEHLTFIAHLPRLEGLIDLVERTRRFVTDAAPWSEHEETLRGMPATLVDHHARAVPGLSALGLTHVLAEQPRNGTLVRQVPMNVPFVRR
jgi:AraC family transcriptional regulator of adaptative response / DNA-3-methyladenine glycosylase II